MPRSNDRLPSVFAYDLRGLAAMRIGLGLLLLADIINRSFSFAALYATESAVPRQAALDDFANPWQLSLHLYAPADWMVAALFALAAAFAIMLAVGYRTRLATVVSWVLLISLHSRNPLVLQGGDEVLRAMVFWGMFLPLGARYSFDRLRTRRPEGDEPTVVFTLATLCLVAQAAMLYAFASLSKTNAVWWRDGLGVYYALWVEQFTTRFGLWVRDLSPTLLQVLNYATLVLQALAPVALLTPWRRDLIRTALPLAMLGLHIGFALSMHLGLFSFIVGVLWIGFLGPPAWDWLEARAPRALGRLGKGPLAAWTRVTERLAAHFARRGPLPEAPPPERIGSSVPARVFLGVTVVFVLWWNLWGINQHTRDYLRIPEPARKYAHVLRLEQRWKMFSNPPKWSQWYVVAGELESGEPIDVFRDGAAISTAKPALVSATLPGDRWRKYFDNLSQRRAKAHRGRFADWACRDWNATHDRRIKQVELRMFRQPSPHRHGLEPLRPDRVVLGRFPCR